MRSWSNRHARSSVEQKAGVHRRDGEDVGGVRGTADDEAIVETSGATRVTLHKDVVGASGSSRGNIGEDLVEIRIVPR